MKLRHFRRLDKINRLRRMQLENLEPRLMLAADWQNALNPLDVNADRHVSASDVVTLVERLNQQSGPLGPRTDPNSPWLDVNGNGSLEAADVVAITSSLNGGQPRLGPVVIDGPGRAVYGQLLDFSFSTTFDGEVEYQIDWDGDGESDEQITGPGAGISVQHVFAAGATSSQRIRVEAVAGNLSGWSERFFQVDGVQIQDGDLVVGGTSGDDQIFLLEIADRVMVFINGQVSGPHQPTGGVIVFGQEGNDYIKASYNFSLPVEFHGGPGDDFLMGGLAADTLRGDEGQDTLLGREGDDDLDGGADNDRLLGQQGNDSARGGPGDDTIDVHVGDDIAWGDEGNDRLLGLFGNNILIGGPGADELIGSHRRDILVGGLDSDNLRGKDGDDIVIGGRTLFDDEQTWHAIREIWTSDADYFTRLAQLQNGAFELNGTVVRDDEPDSVLGQEGQDWFFLSNQDTDDALDNEQVTFPALAKNIALTTNEGVQQMPSVAVNPLDPEHVVVAYMDYSLVDTGYAGIGVAVTRNGGFDWETSQIPVPEPFNQGATHPIAKFDDQGHVFVSYMAATFLGADLPRLTSPPFGPERIPGFQSNNGIFVVRSDDGGANWNDPVAVESHLYDGVNEVSFDVIPDMAIDTVPTLSNGQPNPNYGTMYVTLNRNFAAGEFPGSPNAPGGIEIYLSVSRDQGQSWELQLEPRGGATRSVIFFDVVDPPGDQTRPGEGFIGRAQIAVGAEGVIYVSHFGGGNFAINVSRDGGASFDAPSFATGDQIVFGTGFATAVNETLPNNQFRTDIRRALAADPTRSGSVYAAENIVVNDSVGDLVDPADIFFGRSNDFAGTFDTTFMVGPHPDLTNPPDGLQVPLNDDNDAQSATSSAPTEVASGQSHPRIRTDPDGNIGVIWYDTRRDPAGIKLDVFGTISTDGGQNFSPNFRITNRSFDAHDGVFTNAVGGEEFYIGDYIGLSLAGNSSYAAWTDTRNGSQDVFVARYAIDPAPSPLNDRFEPNDTPDLNTSPTIIGPVIERLLPKLTVTPGDEDWFLVEGSSRGEIAATLLFDDPDSVPADSVELALIDVTGSTVLVMGEDLLDDNGVLIGKQFRNPVNTGEQLLVRVFGAGNETVDYSLQLQSLTQNLGTRAFAELAGNIEEGEKSLYLVRAAAAGAVKLEVTTGNNVQGNLRAQILDAETFAVLATTELLGAATVAELNVPIRQNQPMLILLEGDNGSTGDFTARFDNLDLFTTEGSQTLFFPVPGGPTQATLGDVNGDSNLDALVVSALSDTVSVLLGNGDGTMQVARQFKIGAFVTPVTDVTARLPTFGRDVGIADFNQDNIPDFVATNFASADISLLLGNGDGTAQPQRRFDATPAPFDVDIGDVNGDGLLDVVAIETSLETQIVISSLLGRGDGTFEVQRTSPLPVNGNNGTIRIADFNEDGNADLLVSGDGGDFKVSVLTGDGQGGFTYCGVECDFPAGHITIAVAVGDIDEDGHLDIATVGFESGDGGILLGNGDGTFVNPIPFFGGQAPTSMEMVDYGSQVTLPDGSTVLGPTDGRLDLVVSYSGVKTPTPKIGGPEVVVHPAVFNEQGEFVGLGDRQVLTDAVAAPLDVDVGDFNNDGVPDAAVVDRDGLLIVYGDPINAASNTTAETARDLGTVVHFVDQTQTIVPGRTDAFYKFTVPSEVVSAADQVVDVSLLFEHLEGPGLDAELRDAQGNLLASGERFRVRAAQGEELTLRVFGVQNGTVGAGAFTPIINVLPQIVSVEAQALLPGTNGAPGGPTTNIVLTLQGDRLDPATAEAVGNYTVTHAGVNGILGDGDDVEVPIERVVYSPSTNVDVSSGRTFPTAIRQTVTLVFANALPAGSFRIEVSENVQTAPFNEQEAELLADTPEITGHPLVSLNGQITPGASVDAIDLVMAAGALGDFSVYNQGTAYLTQLHDDLSAILDSQLTALGDDPSITPTIIDEMLARLVPAMGPVGQRETSLIAFFLDPVSIEIDDVDEAEQIDFDLDTGEVVIADDDCYVEVGGNVEIVVCAVADTSTFELHIDDVPETARGAVVIITEDGESSQDITDDMRNGVTDFEFEV